MWTMQHVPRMRDRLRDDFVLADHETAAFADGESHAAPPVSGDDASGALASGALRFLRGLGAAPGTAFLAAPRPRGRSPSTSSQRCVISGSFKRTALARNCLTSGVASAAMRSLVQSTERAGFVMIVIVIFTFRTQPEGLGAEQKSPEGLRAY